MGSSLVIRASQLPTMRSLLILSLAGIVASKVIFPVPEPYRWDETFTVKHPQIDDEHRGLFNAILKVERKNTEANIKEANVKYHDHFTLEQGLFKQTTSSRRPTSWHSLPPTPRRSCTSTSTSTTPSSWP